jgi:hypothetical protein
MANFDWNNDDYQDDRNFDPLEPGVYRLQCVDAEEKTTRSGGTMIAATFEVVGSKRKVWHNFNIVNSNQTAERIGRSQISAWARACGKPQAGSTDQLLHAEFEARLKIEEQSGYKPRNIIDGFIASAGAPAPSKPSEYNATVTPKAAAPKPAPAPKPAAAPASGGQKNPWD